MRDLQRRLTALGRLPKDAEQGSYDDVTDAAVHAFQAERGLTTDGVCGDQTWAVLVEAGYRLGDRLVYHRSPMLRGDDVADLQRQLAALGFDVGRVDGIFGPATAGALHDFQRNAGITTDGVCGRDTLAMLGRLGDRTSQETSAARIRQVEALRETPRSLHGRRIAVGERGGLEGLAAALGRALSEAGALVSVLHHPDHSEQAAEANRFAADAYIGVELDDGAACSLAYFGVPGYESVGGRRLAELMAAGLTSVGLFGPAHLEAMRLPTLRETRMPAVSCRLGPPRLVVEQGPAITSVVTEALTSWARQPVP